MKKSVILIGLALTFGCSTHGDRDPYHPTRPSGVPTTTCDGTPIEWTWEKQRAYDEGKLFFERDSTGCVIVVIRKIK